MTSTEHILLLALGASALGWLALALYTLLTRLLYDAGAAIAGKVAQRGRSGEGAELERLLRRLPHRTVERIAADTATGAETAALFGEHALEGRRDLLASARREGSRRRWERIVALRILARARPRTAIPLLGQALESRNDEVIAAALTALGELSDPRAAELLVDALRRNLFGRSRVAAQLDAAPEQHAALLVPLLREAEPQLRFWGATLLSRYAEDPAVDAELVAATQDGDPSVRAAAVESLAGGGTSRVEAALALLEDPVWFVRAHAARALAGFERDDLAERVAPLLADESWWVRAAAKEMLSACPVAASWVLLDYLEHADEFARNGAAEVLQDIGTLDALIRQAVLSGYDGDLDAVRRVLAAGGERLVATAAARNGLEAEQLERLAVVKRDVAA